MHPTPSTKIPFRDIKEHYVHIWSDEHGAYWREGGHGYTTIKEQAGVFNYDYASRFLGKSYADKMIKLIPAAPEYSI